jgi:ubiquinone/menaquinone biosynthesis C-methylase UbiE
MVLNQKAKFGFPLEYDKLAAYYDVLSQGDDCLNGLLDKTFRKHQVKTVLDFTCGTGAQALWLAKNGYEVVGVDISPALLKIAKEKAHKAKLSDIAFVEGDMRTVKCGLFDAAITIFNAIGHLTKTDFEKTLRNIGRNLNEGGLYVFDIFNLDAMTDAMVETFAMDLKKKVGTKTIRNIQYSSIDRRTGRLTSYDQFTIQRGSKERKDYSGSFTLQLYTADQLSEILARNGFEVMKQTGLDGSRFSKRNTKSVLTVAKRR